MTDALGIGPHAMYGFSPAQDLLAAYLDSKTSHVVVEDDTTTPINILLANPADVRHVLKTIACRRRHVAGGGGGPRRQGPIHVRLFSFSS